MRERTDKNVSRVSRASTPSLCETSKSVSSNDPATYLCSRTNFRYCERQVLIKILYPHDWNDAPFMLLNRDPFAYILTKASCTASSASASVLRIERAFRRNALS